MDQHERGFGLHRTAYYALWTAADEAFGEREVYHVGEPDWSQLPSWELPAQPHMLPHYPGQQNLAPVVQIQRRMLTDSAVPHGHFLAFGLSDLYNHSRTMYEAAIADEDLLSGMGIELSFRLRQPSPDEDLAQWLPLWVAKLFQWHMLYVQSSQRVVLHGHWMRNTNAEEAKWYPGFAYVWDPSFRQLQSSSGVINVVQVVLLTSDEVALCEDQRTCLNIMQVMSETNPDLVSWPSRPSILDSRSARERIAQLAKDAAVKGESTDGVES